MNIEDIRKQFPILEERINGKKLVYLDNAATTQKPMCVLEAMMNYYRKKNANIHRSLHTLSSESTNLWEKAHKDVADFLNAESEKEIIFTKNATESLNFVANTYARQNLKEGDVIAISEVEHHSNILPWLQLSKEKKLKLEWIPVLENFELDSNYLDYLTRKYKSRLKILSISHASNVLGVVNDVKAFAKKIHSVGGVICLDVAQSIAHIPIDVKDLDCDFLCFSGHKMYGPMGIGVVYGKEEILEKLDPWITGGNIVTKVWKNGAHWKKPTERFEAGTANVVDAVGLSEAVRWFEKHRQEECEKELTELIIKELSKISSIEIFGPRSLEKRIGVVSFKHKNIHPHDMSTLMDEEGIAIRGGYHCAEPLHSNFNFGPSARVSFGVYNTEDEVEKFLERLRYISKKFGR